jgi:predicted transcriptional regulator of viral defense system
MSTTTSALTPAGISLQYRGYLELLHRETSAAFGISEAARILDMDDDRTARLLGYLARRGWLSRVRRGLYVAVPLDARRSGEWVEDPWIVANRVFAPCYIGGWSACEHWGFTEQVFNTVLIVSGTKVRTSEIEYPGMRFHVTTRAPGQIFGTSGVWRGQTRVQVSDPSRTVIDVLDDPTIGGGLRHGADVLHEYLASEHRNDSLLVEYGDRVGNRTVFKRLGFLLETRETPAGLDTGHLVEACLERRSAGVTALDPSSAARGRILRRWGLRINVNLSDNGSS